MNKLYVILFLFLFLVLLILNCIKNQSTETFIENPLPDTTIVYPPPDTTIVYPHLLELISPTGNEIYNDGDTVLIKWKPADIEDLHISRMRTNMWESITSGIDARKTTEYRYPIQIGEGSDFWIKISDNQDASIFDITDTALTVIKKEVLLIEPVGGAAFLADQDINIRWNYTSLKNEKVRISISFDDGISWETIVDNFNANVGVFAFKNSMEKTAPKCRIKIEDINNSNYTVESETSFMIYKKIPIDYDYLKLELGNVWNWRRVNYYFHPWRDTSYYKIEIISKEISSDSLDSYRVKITNSQNDTGYDYYTIDKKNGVASLVNGDVYLVYPVGRFVIEESDYPGYSKILYVSENTIELFGKPVKTRSISYSITSVSESHSSVLGNNFGCIEYSNSGDYYISNASLKGCIIDGTVYGDTTLIINSN